MVTFNGNIEYSESIFNGNICKPQLYFVEILDILILFCENCNRNTATVCEPRQVTRQVAALKLHYKNYILDSYEIMTVDVFNGFKAGISNVPLNNIYYVTFVLVDFICSATHLL